MGRLRASVPCPQTARNRAPCCSPSMHFWAPWSFSRDTGLGEPMIHGDAAGEARGNAALPAVPSSHVHPGTLCPCGSPYYAPNWIILLEKKPFTQFPKLIPGRGSRVSNASMTHCEIPFCVSRTGEIPTEPYLVMLAYHHPGFIMYSVVPKG